MKKYIFLCLTLISMVVFSPSYSQDADSTPAETETPADPISDPPAEEGDAIPDWLSYALNAILVAVSGWLAKSKIRLNKAVTLLQTLSGAIDDGTVSSPEVRATVKAAKELVAKEA